MTYDQAKMRIWNPETYTKSQLSAAAHFVLATLDASREDLRQAAYLI
jgi:hypothetical protein